MGEKKSGEKSGKWSLLITGLAIGVVLGGAGMWWMENYVRTDQSITLYQYNPVDTIQQETPSTDISKRTQSNMSAIQDSTELDAVDDTDTLNTYSSDDGGWLGAFDTLSGFYYTPELLAEEALDDYSQWPSRVDTIRHASPMTAEGKRRSAGDDSPVLRDELIFVRQMQITEEQIEADGKVSRKPVPNKLVRVEFWRSPINYVGYKMTDNRLILFGIVAIDSAMLIRRDNTLWLSVMDLSYELTESFDYKPLRAIRTSRPKLPQKASGSS